jgi:hypothetical protein
MSEQMSRGRIHQHSRPQNDALSNVALLLFSGLLAFVFTVIFAALLSSFYLNNFFFVVLEPPHQPFFVKGLF